MMRARAIAAAVPVLLLVFTGCAAQEPEATRTPAPAPTPSDVVNVEDREAPTPDETEETAILDAATAAFGAYARPDLDYGTWWAGLEPLLYPSAVEAYATVLPANIPVSDVGDDPRLFSRVAGATHAVVEFDTNAGVWLVEVRTSDGAWLASRFTPPQP